MNNYTYYNRNPQNMHKSDCVCRAISTAMDMDYYEVEDLLYKNSKYQSCDTLTKSCYRNLLEKEFGLQSHYGRGRTVREIAYRYPHNRVIMRVYGHLTTSVNGECLDTFDCTDEIVDEYWVIY